MPPSDACRSGTKLFCKFGVFGRTEWNGYVLYSRCGTDGVKIFRSFHVISNRLDPHCEMSRAIALQASPDIDTIIRFGANLYRQLGQALHELEASCRRMLVRLISRHLGPPLGFESFPLQFWLQFFHHFLEQGAKVEEGAV